MSRPIHILYEDQRGPMRGFGPHELLVSCVSDDLPKLARREVADRLKAIPKKGDSKLLRACEKDVGGIGARGEPVVALFDDDRIRNLLKLASTTAKHDAASHIRDQSDAPAQLVVWLLSDNIESLTTAAFRRLGKPLPNGKPKPHKRDKILNNAAAWGNSAVRRLVRTDVPTFDCFVCGVVKLMACP